MENNFALASFAASSQYGRLLQAAVTVGIKEFTFLSLTIDESNRELIEISRNADSEICDNLSAVEHP
jgi:hypothetical protein